MTAMQPFRYRLRVKPKLCIRQKGKLALRRFYLNIYGYSQIPLGYVHLPKVRTEVQTAKGYPEYPLTI